MFVIFIDNYFLVGVDIFVDNKMFLVIDFINLKIKSAQSLKDAHNNRVCMYVYMSECYYVYKYLCLYCVYQKII
jgi:hypothetical protein